MDSSISSLKHQLQQLKELHDAGALPPAQYEESKAALERRVLDLVLSDAAALTQKEPPRGAATSGRLLATVAAGIVLIAAGGYWWKGSPMQTDANVAGAAPTAAVEGTTGTPHATNFDQIAAMTDRLAARMKEQPQDAEGWAMLARSYSVLGRHPEALKAYGRAVALRKDDATLLADYADSLAVKNNHHLAGEPMKQVELALKLEPRNLKALSLAGTNAFDRKDYAGAVQYWEKVVQFGPADNSIVQQVQPSLAEARDLAGVPAVAKAADPLAKPQATAATTVSGTVTLAAPLRQQAQPGDTVFVFARATDGSRMPLAIVRKQVKDLPFSFTLDDTTAMSPTNKLSGVAKVIVGARISKSGNAMPQPGDLSGQVGPVSVGAAGLQLDIREAVTP